MSRLIPLLFAIFVSSSAFALHSSDVPADLDALYEQVKHDRVMEQQQNEQREAHFLKEHAERTRLLDEAKARLVEQEKRTESLNSIFQQQEAVLTEQEAALQEKSGSLGELFGTVRQVANESRTVIETSLVSAQFPDRAGFLEMMTDRKDQPTIDDIRQIWLLLQQEMTASSKVIKAPINVITAQGLVEQKEVTRIGSFSAFSDGKFLRYLPETGNLVELGRQPVDRLQKVVAEFEASDSVSPVVIDPTRGAIMSLLVQAPDLKERIQQGGWIGFIILFIGAIGLLIALQRFISLSIMGRAVAKQQKESVADKKNPLGRILSVYSDRMSLDIETLSLKLDEATLREIPKIERGLITLAILAAIAPMLGLLGTVSGMIETFQSITLFGTGDPKLMSGGISQALVTTELGLAVAIPILLIHSLLSSKSNRLVQILDEESAALVASNAEQSNERTSE